MAYSLIIFGIRDTDDGQREVQYAVGDPPPAYATSGRIFSDDAAIGTWIAQQQQLVQQDESQLLALALSAWKHEDPLLQDVEKARGQSATLDLGGAAVTVGTAKVDLPQDPLLLTVSRAPGVKD